MSSFAARILRSARQPIYWVTFKDTQSRDCWFYLISTPEKMRQFAAVRDGIFNIHDYGKAIASGFGKDPTPEEYVKIREEYGLD